jgi:methionyl-tRNA formyltransferase
VKAIFLGSSEFSIPSLSLLVKSGIDIPLVVTKPDKPAGRGLKVQGTPIKEFAQQHKLKVSQDLPTVEQIKKFKADYLVVVAYGKFLPPEMVNGYSCINVHPSLLPKYRGPSPIQSALWNGDKETGVTTMVINANMDAGDILLQERTPIDINENYITLEKRLADIGARLLLNTLRSDVQSLRKEQNDDEATFCRKIKSGDELIDWKKSQLNIHNQVRAFPSYTMVKNKRIKVLETRFTGGKLEIITVQPEGKKPMAYEEFKRGYKVELKPSP